MTTELLHKAEFLSSQVDICRRNLEEVTGGKRPHITDVSISVEGKYDHCRGSNKATFNLIDNNSPSYRSNEFEDEREELAYKIREMIIKQLESELQRKEKEFKDLK